MNKVVEGKKFHTASFPLQPNLTTAKPILAAYKRESERQKELIRKARSCEERLVTIFEAFNQLLASGPFVKLLEAEGLASMPQHLWSKLNHKPKEVT